MTPAEVLLRRLRQQARVTGFSVRLTERRATLHLLRGTRALPATPDTIAFFVALSGDACDRIEVHAGGQPVLVHQLIGARRVWRTTIVDHADAEDDGTASPASACEPPVDQVMQAIAQQLRAMPAKELA